MYFIRFIGDRWHIVRGYPWLLEVPSLGCSLSAYVGCGVTLDEAIDKAPGPVCILPR